jgi:hypothetical protein
MFVTCAYYLTSFNYESKYEDASGYTGYSLKKIEQNKLKSKLETGLLTKASIN